MAWPLLARVENVVNLPLAAGHETFPMTFVRILPDRAGVGPGRTHRTNLLLKDPARLLGHQRLSLLVSTFDTRPDLERAELTLDGTRCIYRTAPGAEFPNNRTLDLTRAEGCVPLNGAPSGRLTLTVVLRNHARLALRTHAAPPSTLTSETITVDPAHEPQGPEALVVSGRLSDPGAPSSRHRRVDLLAYVWQVSEGSQWIWLVVGFGVVAISSGFVGLWHPAATAGSAFSRGLWAFVLACGLGLLYSVVTPPFQAPDEPHHFAAFTEVASRPDVAGEIEAWAALGHFLRIRFRPAEQFTPSNIGTPEPTRERWAAPENAVRGSAVHVLWGAVAPLLRPMTAPRMFLALRLTHAVVMALLIGLVVAILVRYCDVPSPHLLAFPILLVPTLPFFGMHVSNHAPLIGAYVFIAAGLALMALTRKNDRASGLVVGGGWALAIMLSRSAIPLAPLIAAFAGARLLFGPSPSRIRGSLWFWAGLVMPISLALSLSDATYRVTNTKLAGGVIPVALLTPVDVLVGSPWLLTLAAPLLAGLEWAFGRLRAQAGHPLRAAVRAVTRWAALSAAAVVTVVMVGSIFVRYPVVASIDALNRPPAVEYAGDVVWAGLTILRFAGPDYRTSVSFWGGFGWLETLPSDWFVSMLTGATGLALVSLLVQIGRTLDTRRAWFLAAAVAGFWTSLAAYALSLGQIANASSLQKVELAIDISGRYLFGLYLAMVVTCWSGLSLIPSGPSRNRPQSAVALGCVVACTGIHAYCLRLILYRYF